MNVIYVDKDDNVIGAGSIADAIKNGFGVQISRVFLTNSKGEILLQQRSPRIDSWPNKWDQTAAGHVDEGENYAIAAKRELLEEMGIDGVELTPVTKIYTEETYGDATRKRFNTIFIGKYDGEVKIDNDEVSGYKWIMPEELNQQMKDTPEEFTSGFILAYEAYKDSIM